MIKRLKKITLLDVKNNLAVILLFPALIGGLWQLLELSKMSISFIRFFSPTQLLPDGLLILFMLSLIYLSIQLGLGLIDTRINFKRKIIDISLTKPSHFLTNYIKPIKTSKLVFIDNPIYNKERIWLYILQLILGVLSIILIIFSFEYTTEEFRFTFLSFLMFLTLFILFGKMFSTSSVVLFVFLMENKYDRVKNYLGNKPIRKSILKEIFILLIQFFTTMIVLLLFLIFPIIFHKEYMLPENLKNLESISTSLKDNNYTSNKISYFNDKYIFIEHISEDKNTTIEILKFDKLFDSK